MNWTPQQCWGGPIQKNYLNILGGTSKKKHPVYSLEPEGSGAGGGRRDEVCGHGADGAVDRGEAASGDVVHSSSNLKSWIWEVLVLCV